REQDRQHDDHEQRHRQRDPAPAARGLCHLSLFVKHPRVPTRARRGGVAPSGARSLWLDRPSSRPRTLLAGLGTASWAVSLPTTKKRNLAAESNGATSSSVCPVATAVRHSAVRPGRATDGLNS